MWWSALAAVAFAGCYTPTAAPGAPCSERFTCPGDQECDRSASPPVCREPGSTGPDAAPDGAPDTGSLGPWGPPVMVMMPVGQEDDPTLTGDMLELVFNRDGTEIWRVRRASPAAAWGAPERVVELGAATTPELTSDGRTIYIASDRATTLDDIWVSSRVDLDAPWSPPVRVDELSSPTVDETNATPSRDHLSIVLARRVPPRGMEVLASSRGSLQAPWGSPVRLVELGSPVADGDPMLSVDELEIYMYSTRAGMGDLYVARRASRAAPFGEPQPIAELNRPDALDQDPWISPDGRRLFFSSNRGGQLAIYESAR